MNADEMRSLVKHFPDPNQKKLLNNIIDAIDDIGEYEAPTVDIPVVEISDQKDPEKKEEEE